MFTYLIAVNVLLLWSSSKACNPNEWCGIDTDNENIQNLLASMDYFTAELIHNLYNPQQPFASPGVVSPMAIYTILVLVLFGSAGNTQKELIQALHFPDGDLQQLKKSFGDILIATEMKLSKTIDGNEDVFLEGHVAEGIFIQKEFTFVKEYADYLSALNIKTNPVDFLNMQDVTKAVYSWIDENTPGSSSAAKSFSSQDTTRIYLTSLFYFTAKWSNNLFLDKKVETVPFHTLDNTVININMMKASTSLLYYDNASSYSAIEIPYESFAYAAIIILPHKGVNPVTFLTTFTMSILDEFFSNAEVKDVDCQIPTLSYTYSFGLNDQMQKFGIKELFAEADLSGMLEVPKQNLGVQISHNVPITVDEKGTNAGNLSVEPVPKDPPPTDLTPFIADRPFLMLIRSASGRAIAFATFFHSSSNTVSIAVPG